MTKKPRWMISVQEAADKTDTPIFSRGKRPTIKNEVDLREAS